MPTLMRDIHWTPTLKTAPTIEPVAAAEVRQQLRIDSAEEDSLLNAYIEAARIRAEEVTGRALVTQTWELRMDAFPDEIRCPRPPLIAVSSIQYIDTNGDTQSFTDYIADTKTEPGRIVPGLSRYGINSVSWPTTLDTPNAVTVTYTAGYGATAASVPRIIRLAIMHVVAHWYENREPVNIGNIVNPIPGMAEELLKTQWHGWNW
jgi:uncharacterized phiE125 gp8 family phage protein